MRVRLWQIAPSGSLLMTSGPLEASGQRVAVDARVGKYIRRTRRQGHLPCICTQTVAQPAEISRISGEQDYLPIAACSILNNNNVCDTFDDFEKVMLLSVIL